MDRREFTKRTASGLAGLIGFLSGAKAGGLDRSPQVDGDPPLEAPDDIVGHVVEITHPDIDPVRHFVPLRRVLDHIGVILSTPTDLEVDLSGAVVGGALDFRRKAPDLTEGAQWFEEGEDMSGFNRESGLEVVVDLQKIRRTSPGRLLSATRIGGAVGFCLYDTRARSAFAGFGSVLSVTSEPIAEVRRYLRIAITADGDLCRLEPPRGRHRANRFARAEARRQQLERPARGRGGLYG